MKSAEHDKRLRATRARLENGWVCVLLNDGREIRFPAEMNNRLRKGTVKEQKNIQIICNGTGLHWPDLDEDISVQGILEGRFGQVEATLEAAAF